MARRSWRITLDGVAHVVEIEHGYWTARRRITVDGRGVVTVDPRLFGNFTYWTTSTAHPFAISGHPAEVRIRPGTFRYDFELVVDGMSVTTGAPAAPLLPPKHASTTAPGTTAPERTHWWQWIAWAAVIFGLPTVFLFGEVRYLIEGREAPGVVIERYETAGRSTTNSHLRYRFVSEDGRARVGSQIVSFDLYQATSVGDTVTVQYLASDPGTTRVDREIERRYEWIYLLISDLALAAIAVPMFVSRARERARERVAESGTLTRGTIVSVEGRRSSGAEYWLISYAYRDDTGVERDGTAVITGDGGAALRSEHVGQVRFDPAHPNVSVWIG